MLILVLWISIGLVAIALYFANSMTFELRASDNRATGIAAEQAIEGAARYVSYALSNFATNGAVPNNTQFSCEAVPVGDAHFWLIGRDPSGTPSTEPYFGLVDEASKLNLNRAGTNTLSYLPNMTLDFADAIVDWRSTNGSGDYALDYASLGYTDKNSPFETVDELRLVYGATIDLLVGEDINRNGVLDVNEKDVNGNGTLDPGLFEYVTVYSRQPNFHSDGTTLTNVTQPSQLRSLFQPSFGTPRALKSRTPFTIGFFTAGNGKQQSPIIRIYCDSIWQRNDSAEFAKVANGITDTTIRTPTRSLNINTAGAPVMKALFMGWVLTRARHKARRKHRHLPPAKSQQPQCCFLDRGRAWQQQFGHHGRAGAGGDYVTTRSYQFTADIAAVGPFGRGYRRVKFIFEMA